MSWSAILILGAGAYVFKATGVLALSKRSLPGSIDETLTLLPAILLVSLSVVQTFSDGSQLALDARAPGLAIAVLLVSIRMPLPLVIIGAALGTAVIRILF